LYTKVLSQTDREHLISNIAGNLGNAKSAEIKARQRTSFYIQYLQRVVDVVAVSVFAAVDQGLSDAIAKAIGAPTVQPLKVASASEVAPFKTNIGKTTVAVARF
jgi:catalase